MNSKRYATRNFTDAGTNKSFKTGQELTGLSEGELGNYEHAGLAGDKPDEAPAADKVPAGTDKVPGKGA
jgi:hypothetical protein